MVPDEVGEKDRERLHCTSLTVVIRLDVKLKGKSLEALTMAVKWSEQSWQGKATVAIVQRKVAGAKLNVWRSVRLPQL